MIFHNNSKSPALELPLKLARPKGTIKWEILKNGNYQPYKEGTHSNIILNTFLNDLANVGVGVNQWPGFIVGVGSNGQADGRGVGSYLSRCRVGIDGRVPAPTDSGLFSQIAQTGFVRSVVSTNLLGSETHTIEYLFGPGAINNTIREIGFSTPGNIFISRSLFRDEVGNPIEITLTSEDQLRIFYTMEITYPTNTSLFSLDIENLGIYDGSFRLLAYRNTGIGGTLAGLANGGRFLGALSGADEIGAPQAINSGSAVRSAFESGLHLIEEDPFNPGNIASDLSGWGFILPPRSFAITPRLISPYVQNSYEKNFNFRFGTLQVRNSAITGFILANQGGIHLNDTALTLIYRFDGSQTINKGDAAILDVFLKVSWADS